MTISHVIPATPKQEPDINVPHYVPGRKLTSDDLQHERDAALKQFEYMGRAAGTGIIEGLWVEKSKALELTVSKGLGINASGHPISLNADKVTLDLSPTTLTNNASLNNIIFEKCTPSRVVLNTNGLADGPYLLTAKPIHWLSDEMTPIQKILPRKIVDDCTNKWEQESIIFRTVYLGIPQGFNDDVVVPQGVTPDLMNKLNTQRHNQHRNLLAHWAFGTKNLLSVVRDPFNRWSDLNYSGLELARSAFEVGKDLTDCDLRLAVFYLETTQNVQSIQFVDNWAVRRRLSRPSQFPARLIVSGKSGLTGWGQRTNDQLAAEGEARFSQFQEHLDDLRPKLAGKNWAADQYMRYLPSAGYVPLAVSDVFLKALSQHMVNFFLEEIKKSSPTSSVSQLSSISFMLPLLGQTIVGGTHVSDVQMNNLISQLNAIFGIIANTTNILALAASQQLVFFEPIQPLKPNLPNTDSTTWEVDTNNHIIDKAFNNRIMPIINTWLSQLTTLINRLGINFSVTIPTFQLTPVTGEIGIVIERLHFNITVFNNSCINPLNAMISQLISTINALRWLQIGTDLSGKLQSRLSSIFATTTNGVFVEKFFANTSDVANNAAVAAQTVYSSYIKNLAFTDRQSIENTLEESWQAPAIDLTKDKNLSLTMVYEDIIPYVAEQLKTTIENDQFTDQGTIRIIWGAGVRTTFENIIARKSGDSRAPLYGLFFQAIYPLQMTIWHQGAVTIDTAFPEINEQPPVVVEQPPVVVPPEGGPN